MKLTDCDGLHFRIYRVKTGFDRQETIMMLHDNGYDMVFGTMLPEDHSGLSAVFGQFDSLSYMESPSGLRAVILERR